jgi:hypothetical protein
MLKKKKSFYFSNFIIGFWLSQEEFSISLLAFSQSRRVFYFHYWLFKEHQKKKPIMSGFNVEI